MDLFAENIISHLNALIYLEKQKLLRNFNITDKKIEKNYIHT